MGFNHNWNGIDVIKGFNKTSLRHSILSSHKILIGTFCCFMLISCLGFTHLHAGPYAGFISAGDFIDAYYNKTVDNTHPQNVSTQKGKVNRAESNTVGGINGLGYQIGYRIPFGKDVFSSAASLTTCTTAAAFTEILRRREHLKPQTNLGRVGPSSGRFKGLIASGWR